MLRPLEAAAIRERKVDALARTGASMVASANPGCILHLRAAGLDVSHPMEIIDRTLGLRSAQPTGKASRGR